MLKQSYKKIHFVGVGGAGVSALARLMLQRGYEVTGSDLQLTETTRELSDAGANIWEGHDERYARHADLIVTSTAIPASNPEIAYAREKGKPLLTRIELLSYLASGQDSVVISGSHGKSTTTSMVAWTFYMAQKDPTFVIGSAIKDPTNMIGGKIPDNSLGSARHGKSRVFVCEGDESNNSILQLKPKVAVVTNIDCDHMDFHGSLSNLKNSFVTFLNSPPRDGFSVVCLEDTNVRSILKKINSRVITYGFSEACDYSARNRRVNSLGGLSFDVHHKEQGPLGVINLQLPGDHNVLNALATVAVCCSMGLAFPTVALGLETFPGVSRRYDIVYNREVTIIDDYAHHPSEIHALLQAAREVFGQRRIRCVFQPHRFTRSKQLAEQFPPAFIDADEVILAPIYTAHETPIAGIGLDYLNRFFQTYMDERKLRCVGHFGDIEKHLRDSMRPGDVILTVGAGDVFKIGYRLGATLRERESQVAEGVDIRRLQQSLSDESLFFAEN